MRLLSQSDKFYVKAITFKGAVSVNLLLSLIFPEHLLTFILRTILPFVLFLRSNVKYLRKTTMRYRIHIVSKEWRIFGSEPDSGTTLSFLVIDLLFKYADPSCFLRFHVGKLPRKGKEDEKFRSGPVYFSVEKRGLDETFEKDECSTWRSREKNTTSIFSLICFIFTSLCD